MNMRTRITVGVACTAALIAAAAGAAAPAAAGQHDSGWEHGGDHHSGAGYEHGSDWGWPDLALEDETTLAEGLISPLSLDVDRDGVARLSQNFAGLLTAVDDDGTVSTVVSAPPGQELGAVSARHGTVYYAENDQPAGAALLFALDDGGEPRLLADLGAYEATENPDQVNTYGFTDLDDACVAQVDPAGPGGPATYQGQVDPHPYASLATRDGVYVADAGGNDILRVTDDGEISTVAVLPPTEAVTVTAETAAAFGFPECVVGHDYAFEPVPTDVERGPDGSLYVTSLPGGPEDASLGLRGSVYRVDPWSGESTLVATGFAGATGLAVDRDSGIVLVAELFGGPDGTGQISAVSPASGEAFAVFAVPSPAAIELHDGELYATTSAFVPDETGAPQPIGALTRWTLTDRNDGDCWGDGDDEED
jgi:hypothetical protein